MRLEWQIDYDCTACGACCRRAHVIGEVQTHVDTGRSRSVWLGDGMQGSELQTLCGKWLPAWLDGPDGDLNRSRWAIFSGGPPTCPVCAELSG